MVLLALTPQVFMVYTIQVNITSQVVMAIYTLLFNTLRGTIKQLHRFG